MSAAEEGADGVSFDCWELEVLGTESRKNLSVSFLLKEMMMMMLPEKMPCKNLFERLSVNGNCSSLLLRDPSLW